ncbi:MAG: hypothetical protein AB1483_06460 [Candidatus Zixiibacteriota bacterium]
MRISWSDILNTVVTIVLCLTLNSCGKNEVADKQTVNDLKTDSTESASQSIRVGADLDPGAEPIEADYSEWQETTVGMVKVFYPPDHAHRNSISGLAQTYGGALRSACRFLGINTLPDTLFVFYYTGPGQGRGMTGQQYPFYVGDTLHQWPPFALGTPLVKYLLPKWQSEPTKHIFLEHGLKALLDNSGTDYHARTLEKLENGTFMPLREMATDTTFNSNVERAQSAVAASFVDFVVYVYGMDKFKELWTSKGNFEADVKAVLGIDIDSLQEQWLTTIKQAVAQSKQSNG